jgi:hypothetical protein
MFIDSVEEVCEKDAQQEEEEEPVFEKSKNDDTKK